MKQEGAIAIIRLVGDLSGTAVETAAAVLSEATDGPDARLVIDLSETKSIDSTGLSELISIVTKSRLRNGEVVLLAPTPFVAGVLSVTRLDSWFAIVDSLDEAKSRLTPP